MSDSELPTLSQLVKEGRYELFVTGHGLCINCTECGENSEDWLSQQPVNLDPVVVLEYIEEHEAEHHKAADLNVHVPLIQVMLAYAQQRGKSVGEMLATPTDPAEGQQYYDPLTDLTFTYHDGQWIHENQI